MDEYEARHTRSSRSSSSSSNRSRSSHRSHKTNKTNQTDKTDKTKRKPSRGTGTRNCTQQKEEDEVALNLVLVFFYFLVKLPL